MIVVLDTLYPWDIILRWNFLAYIGAYGALNSGVTERYTTSTARTWPVFLIVIQNTSSIIKLYKIRKKINAKWGDKILFKSYISKIHKIAISIYFLFKMQNHLIHFHGQGCHYRILNCHSNEEIPNYSRRLEPV